MGEAHRRLPPRQQRHESFPARWPRQKIAHSKRIVLTNPLNSDPELSVDSLFRTGYRFKNIYSWAWNIDVEICSLQMHQHRGACGSPKEASTGMRVCAWVCVCDSSYRNLDSNAKMLHVLNYFLKLLLLCRGWSIISCSKTFPQVAPSIRNEVTGSLNAWSLLVFQVSAHL